MAKGMGSYSACSTRSRKICFIRIRKIVFQFKYTFQFKRTLQSKHRMTTEKTTNSNATVILAKRSVITSHAPNKDSHVKVCVSEKLESSNKPAACIPDRHRRNDEPCPVLRWGARQDATRSHPGVRISKWGLIQK